MSAPPPKPAKPAAFRPDKDAPVKPPKPTTLIEPSSPSSAPKGPKEVYAATLEGEVAQPKCIRVPRAKDTTSKDGSETFMAYEVNVTCGSKTTVAPIRFSAFADFHKEWKKQYPTVDIALPAKKLSVSDDDVARRCVDLQDYLRNMCQVAALIFHVAKFLGVSEADLKAACKGSSGAKPAAPAVAAAEPLSRTGSGDAPSRTSVRLPKISLKVAEAERAATSPAAIPEPAKVVGKPAAAAAPAPVVAAAPSPKVAVAAPTPVKATPASAKASPPPPISMTGGTSVKDRMLAFQKKT